MPVPQYTDYISQITLPSGITYHIKDSEARQWINELIAGGLTFVVAWDGTSVPDVTKIPSGAVVKYNGNTYTGTMAASLDTKPNIYLVHSDVSTTGRDIYEEYVTVNFGTTSTPSWGWEALGNTDISLDVLGALAWKNTVTLNKGSGETVLGQNTTFTGTDSAVTFSGGSTDNFIKSYPGTTSKLVKNTVRGVKTDSTTTASKATAGTTISVAKAASSATNVSYIGNASTTSILETATVAEGTEILVIGTVTISQNSITGTNGTASITPYTFADVTVPVRADTDSSFATGALANDGTGDAVMTSLGTPVTGAAVTDVGTGTAAAQTITVGTNDQVKIAKYSDLSVSVS